MILYFTGTGNSTYVAEKIAEMTADSLISMTDKIRENSCENINAEKTLVFVTPTYNFCLWQGHHKLQFYMFDTIF